MKGARLREKLFRKKSWESVRAFCPADPLLLCRKSRKKAPQYLRLPGEVMAKVSVLNVAVLENPSPFHSPFRFEISFECSEALSDGEAGPMQGTPNPPDLVCATPSLPGNLSPGPTESPISNTPPWPNSDPSVDTTLYSLHCLVEASSPLILHRLSLHVFLVEVSASIGFMETHQPRLLPYG